MKVCSTDKDEVSALLSSLRGVLGFLPGEVSIKCRKGEDILLFYFRKEDRVPLPKIVPYSSLSSFLLYINDFGCDALHQHSMTADDWRTLCSLLRAGLLTIENYHYIITQQGAQVISELQVRLPVAFQNSGKRFAKLLLKGLCTRPYGQRPYQRTTSSQIKFKLERTPLVVVSKMAHLLGKWIDSSNYGSVVLSDSLQSVSVTLNSDGINFVAQVVDTIWEKLENNFSLYYMLPFSRNKYLLSAMMFSQDEELRFLAKERWEELQC